MRPDLMPREVAQAPSVTAKDFEHMHRLAADENWASYFGAPRHASVALGRRDVEERSRQHIAMALRILNGLDVRNIPRYSTMIAKVPGVSEVMDRSAKWNAKVEERQRKWLPKKKRP
jgi:hypothetical protein